MEKLHSWEMDNVGVQKFYTGQTVFLTGATGFFGRAITEKLLRACPDVRKLYLFIRPKKGVNSQERINKLFDDPVFELMKKENPDFKSKVSLIAGDLSIPDIGISETDRKTLIDEVTVVFHGGATVRFDAKLKTAININVSGTKEILQICSECKNLKALVHISTAYSNCNRDKVEEIIYPPPITGHDVINLAKFMPDEIMEKCTPTIIQGWPNTYAFTKQIGEDLVKREAIAKNIPAAIYRPAIVVGAYNEPIPGWIDNVYGPTGVMAGIALGLLRTMHLDFALRGELVPIDFTVNAAFAIAWDVAGCKRIHSRENELPINTVETYNFVTAKDNPVKWGDIEIMMKRHGPKIPSVKSVWFCFCLPTKYYPLYCVYALFLHILPAILIDCALIITGKKPQALKIYERIHKFSGVLAYFCTQEWEFHNSNMTNLWAKLSKEDKVLFNYDMNTVDWNRFFDNNLKAMRYYIAKDPIETVPEGRRKFFKLRILHYTTVAILCMIFLWLFWSPTSILINLIVPIKQ